MPQSTYLPFYTAAYPILAKVQKPGGVTVLTTVGAGDVPNKPTYVAGTVQMLEVEETVQETDESGDQVERTTTVSVTRSATVTRSDE